VRHVYPPLLAHEGHAAAVRAVAHRSIVPLTLELGTSGGCPRIARTPSTSADSRRCRTSPSTLGEDAGATVRLKRVVHFSVNGDGDGFEPGAAVQGAGITNMADRIGAVDGTLGVRSKPGEGTTVEIRVSVAADEHERSDDAVHV
jgi:hypothetical protein